MIRNHLLVNFHSEMTIHRCCCLVLWSFEVTLEVVDGCKCSRMVDDRRSYLLLVDCGRFDGVEFVRRVVV